MQMELEELAGKIKTWGMELGFQQVGITDLDLSAHEPHVRRWLARGFAGDMGYMARNLEKRLHPELLEPQTCSVVTARMDYLPPDTRPLEVLNDRSRAYVSRYAVGRDYHKVLRARLARLARRISGEARTLDARYGAFSRAFTDSAPVLEKALAEKAGLGWIGKHSLLLNRTAGSWFFLGEIYTSAPLPPDNATNEDHCGKCQACINVCPTRAIVGPRQLDARRCISYLTIEHRGSIPEEFRAPMGNRVFGCDDCQLFCPWNRFARHSAEDDFKPRHELDQASLVELFGWSETDFMERTAGSAIRRINYQQWQRNLAVALGNGTPSEEAIKALEQRKACASPMLLEHIQWALARLRSRQAGDGAEVRPAG